MSKIYSDAEIAVFKAYYEEHGVVRLPGFVDKVWVDRIEREIEHAMTRADEVRRPDEALSFGRAAGRMTIRHQWRENPVVREFLLRRELAETIARIVDTETLRFWFDLTFIHEGGNDGETGVGTGWHHDISAFTFKGDQLPSLWMAMTPANAERSRLMFIDKSHRNVEGYYRPPGTPDTFNGKPDGMLSIPDFDAVVARGEAEIITWDCDPGDAIIIHPFVIHAASGNSGKAQRRVAITTRWLGDDVRYLPTHGNVQPQVPGIDHNPVPVGGRPTGEYFPLVYDARQTRAQAA